MTRVWLFLVVFLLVLSVFRMVNGASFIGVSEILIKLETVNFDISPLLELEAFFSDDAGDSDSYVVIGPVIVPPTVDETVDENGNVGFDVFESEFDLLGEIWNDLVALYELMVIFVKIAWMPFDLLFQVLDVGLWMLGFTA